MHVLPIPGVELPAMMELPESFTTRTTILEDAEEVAALLAAGAFPGSGEADMTAEEIRDDWADIDLAEESVTVVSPDGRIAGYADVVNRSYVSVYGYVHPDFHGLGIGAYLVGWGEGWTRDHMPRAPEEARVSVTHYINARNTAARSLLESAGYAPVRGTYVMEIQLRDAPPEPQWPEGITVRTFVPGDECAVFEAVEDAFMDVWNRSRGTFERFAGLTERESFDPSLWFLAMDGDEIAGTVLAKKISGEGWVDVAGVRRPWRGRGLGLALLRHAFGEYHRRGVVKAGLSVDAESITGAPRLYGRAGMHVASEYVVYQKELRSGVDLGKRRGLESEPG
ncbi:MAG: GNAT family N-acetyltransferase [Rubrobacter sp.]|nr:GNAT family N-acetyltransferase [Rubrobacter sp.]